ncbi:MAG: hypothetical protein M1419_08580, partial [Bacteroidetes bacterium]|nr:hypothetical protein [Bacteroidota bacterium]
MNQNLKYLVDFIVKMDYDKGTADKVAVELSKVLEGKLPKDLLSPEAINNTIAGLKQIQESGVDVTQIFEDLSSSFDDTALQDLSVEFGSLLENIGNIDLGPLEGMFDALSPDQIEAFGSALNDSFANIDVGQLGEAFNQIKANMANLKEGGAKAGKETGEGIAHGIGSAGPKAHGEGKHVGNEAKHGLQESLKEIPSMMLAMFGGSMLTQGFMGITQGIESIFEAGKELHENLERMELGFASAGLAGEDMEKQMGQTKEFAAALSQEFGVGASAIRDYSAQAALLGGSTGKMNEDITKLAVGLTKASGGLVDASMIIRVFSRGLADPEAEANLGRLKMTFPALATALKGITEPAELTRVALEKMNPMFELMTEQAQRPVGAMERFENALMDLKKNVGLTLVEGLSPLIDFIGTEVVPTVLGMAKGVRETTHWIEEHKEVLLTIATPLAILTAAYVWQNLALGEMIAKKSVLVLTWIPKKIKALFAETAATEGTTAAQRILNNVMNMNPYVLAIASIAALVGAMKVLNDMITITTAEQRHHLEGQKEKIEKNIEETKSNIETAKSNLELIKSYTELGQKQNKTAEETNRFEDALLSLKDAYPKLVDTSKSFAENLKNLASIIPQTQKELLGLQATLRGEQKFELELNVALAKNAVQQTGEDINDLIGTYETRWGRFWEAPISILTERLGDFFVQVRYNITTGKVAQDLAPLYEGMKKATNLTELNRAYHESFAQLKDNPWFKDLPDDLQAKVIEGFKGYREKQKEVLEATKQVIAADTAEFFSKQISKGVDSESIKNAWKSAAEKGKDMSSVVQGLNRDWGITDDQLIKILGITKEELDKIKQTVPVVQDLAGAWQQVNKTTSEALNTSLGKLNEMIRKKKEGEDFNQAEYDAELKNAQNLDKKLDSYNKINEENKKRIGIT